MFTNYTLVKIKTLGSDLTAFRKNNSRLQHLYFPPYTEARSSGSWCVQKPTCSLKLHFQPEHAQHWGAHSYTRVNAVQTGAEMHDCSHLIPDQPKFKSFSYSTLQKKHWKAVSPAMAGLKRFNLTEQTERRNGIITNSTLISELSNLSKVSWKQPIKLCCLYNIQVWNTLLTLCQDHFSRQLVNQSAQLYWHSKDEWLKTNIYIFLQHFKTTSVSDFCIQIRQ